MATFEITGPDGKKYRVTGETAEGALSALQKHLGAAPKPSFGQTLYENVIGSGEVDTPGERLGQSINDAGKAFFAGLGRGAAAIPDLPGKLVNAGGGVLSGALEASGAVSPQTVGMMRDAIPMLTPFGSGETATDALRSVTGGASDYRGGTTAGQYAGTVGEFVPGALVAGGLGAVPQFAVAPGVASEFAGRATKGKKLPDWVPLIGGSDAEPVARMAAAVAAPFAVDAARRIVTPNPADPARIAAAERLKEEGVDVTAGQRAGNSALRYQEDAAARTSRIAEGQNEQFTAAALKRIGETATRADPETMARAYGRIGGMFDDLAARNTVVADTALMDDVKDAFEQYARLTNKSAQSPIVKSALQRVQNAFSSGKPLAGAEYQTLRSDLGVVSRGSDATLSQAAKKIVEALDEGLGRTLQAAGNTDDLALYATARQQYRDFLAIEKAVSMAGENAALGIVTPARLRSAVAQVFGRRGYVTGKSDLGNLSRDGTITMSALPNSGTQPRMAANAIAALSGAPAGGAAGMLAYALTQNPTLAAGVGAMSSMMPAVRNAAIGSRAGQAYLGNQLLPALGKAASAKLLGLLPGLTAQ